MKLASANKKRAELVNLLYAFFNERGEDVGMITSNSFNFPCVVDGEEGWVEIVAKVTKESGDEGYDKREEYAINLRNKAEKAKAAAEAKAKKIAKDKARREAQKEG